MTKRKLYFLLILFNFVLNVFLFNFTFNEDFTYCFFAAILALSLSYVISELVENYGNRKTRFREDILDDNF